MKITINRARASLIAIFLVSLILQFLAAIYAFSKKRIYDDELQSLIVKLLAIYSIPFAVIAGGIFGQGKSRVTRFSPLAFWLALALSCVWNLLLLWRSLMFGFAKQGAINQLLGYLEGVSTAGSFLVAGALAYFFTKRSE